MTGNISYNDLSGDHFCITDQIIHNSFSPVFAYFEFVVVVTDADAIVLGAALASPTVLYLIAVC